MRTLRRLKRAWSSLFHSGSRDVELDDELAAHLAHEIDARVAGGESVAEATRQAHLALGRVAAVSEETRAQRSFAFLTGLSQDLSFALRLMRKSPVFTLAAVGSLALGIGANTAIYSLYSRILIDEMPVHAPSELYQLLSRTSNQKAGQFNTSYSYPFIRELQENSPQLQGVTCSANGAVSLRSGAQSKIVSVEEVCGNYFSLLGIQPALGRLLQPADNVDPGAHPVAVLSHHYWRSEYGSDPEIVGRRVEFNGHPFTIVGITPPNYFSFSKGNLPNFFVPIVMDGVISSSPTMTTDPGSYWISVVMRTKPGVSLASLESEIAARYRRYRAANGGTSQSEYQKKVESTLIVHLESAAQGFGTRSRVESDQKPLTLLLCVVGAVLLIACINIANLLLARATARQREIATRLALGASRMRLVRQFLTESLLLAASGGVAGLALALTLERALMREAYGKNAQLLVDGGPSWLVLLACFGLTIVAGFGFGLAPALSADRQGIRAPRRMVGRKLLVSLQVALSILLLMGAGLFLKTLSNLRTADSGFVRDQLVTMQLTPGLLGRKPEELRAYYRNVEQRVAEVPGVAGVSFNAVGLLAGSRWGSGIQVAGVVIPEGEPAPLRNAVGPKFFSMIGARFIEGRDFEFADNSETAPKVAIVNQSFARRYFGNSSAIGRMIGPGNRETKPSFTIVGVVADLRDARITAEAERYWYVPYAQQNRLPSLTLTARAQGESVALLKMIQAEVARVDPNVPISRQQTMATTLEDQISLERLVARVSSFFALVAVLLAVIGLYGVMAYTVERRTREIGIRMALGEERSRVLGGVLREALLYVGIGVLMGIPLALGLARFSTKLLYGVQPMDWMSLSIAVATITGFGMLAGFLTARRAASIEPMMALRIE
ncbi:ABC transporter permease [Bryobacter aggregatus]|uniref:ABC transporter permease n=1 Tax=Bryobacter aggregatus TaxID=360054 RepID=UPI0004E21F5A|nr:ABC transporter permease [Bryobacter aggregatus]